MKKFPQFLKSNPTFHGLQFSDLAGLMVILYLAMIMNLNPLITVFLSVLLIAVMKVLKRYLDFTGFFSPRTKGILLRESSRGEE